MKKKVSQTKLSQNSSLNELPLLLKQSGLRLTPVRLGVLQALSKSVNPVDVSHILSTLPEHTDTVTVYRTLKTFTAKKIVHRIHSAEGSWLYALDKKTQKLGHNHPHFVCDKCGVTECITISPIQKISKVAVKLNYQVILTEIILHGFCPKCH